MEQLDFKEEGVKFVEELGSVESSDTQSIKLVKIEKEGEELYSFQKWWKKDPDDGWIIGKGFRLSEEQLNQLLKQVKYKL